MVLYVQPDPKLRRDGVTIQSEITVSYLQAILGDRICIDTVDGPEEITLPAGTQPGVVLTLKDKGVLGCIADGYVRDVDFLIAMGFQTWSRGFTPRDIVGYWLPSAVDVDIRIGDVIIAPGDYMLADRDGCLRVPKAIVEDVIARAETAISTENKVRTAILAGVDPQKAYLEFGKF